MSALQVTEAIEEMAELCMERADVIEPLHPETARAIRDTAERFREVVAGRGPRWYGIAELERVKGWSRSWLRDKASELAAEGKARKDPYWEIRADAAAEIPTKSSREREPIDVSDDLEATASRLAAEE